MISNSTERFEVFDHRNERWLLRQAWAAAVRDTGREISLGSSSKLHGPRLAAMHLRKRSG